MGLPDKFLLIGRTQEIYYATFSRECATLSSEYDALSSEYSQCAESEQFPNAHYTCYHVSHGAESHCEFKSCKVTLGKQEINQVYYLPEVFDPAQDTVVCFPGNGGLGSGLFDQHESIRTNYNVVEIDYLGYASHIENKDGKVLYNVPKKLGSPTFDDTVEAADQVLGHVLQDLQTKYSNEEKSSPNNKVILCGCSMGSMVATKLAARNEQKGQEKFKFILNIDPVLDMNTASKSSLKNTMKNIGQSPCAILFITVLALLAYAILFSIFFGISYGFLRIKLPKQPSFQYAAIVAAALPIIVVSLTLMIYLCEAKSVGITKKDMEYLKEQPMYFIQMKNDDLCNNLAVEEQVKGKDNMHFTYITDESNKDTARNNISYLNAEEVGQALHVRNINLEQGHNYLSEYVGEVLQYAEGLQNKKGTALQVVSSQPVNTTQNRTTGT